MWCVRDDPKNQKFRIVCRTLYDVRLKKHLNANVERFYSIPYSQLWVVFGINIATAA